MKEKPPSPHTHTQGTGLLPVAFSVSFLTQPRTTCLGQQHPQWPEPLHINQENAVQACHKQSEGGIFFR